MVGEEWCGELYNASVQPKMEVRITETPAVNIN